MACSKIALFSAFADCAFSREDRSLWASPAKQFATDGLSLDHFKVQCVRDSRSTPGMPNRNVSSPEALDYERHGDQLLPRQSHRRL